jgi:hypothetical protein
MNALILLLTLARLPYEFDPKYVDACMPDEDAGRCESRKKSWARELKDHQEELRRRFDANAPLFRKEVAAMKVEVAPGREAVGPVAPTWCTKPPSEYDDLAVAFDLVRHRQAFEEQRYTSFDPLLFGAEKACLLPRDPDVQKVVGAMVQSLVNLIGYSKAEAIADLSARLDRDGFKASKVKLCEALPKNEEAVGDLALTQNATKLLFGCGDADRVDAAMWVSGDREFNPQSVYFLDGALVPESELLRLFWLMQATRFDEPMKPWQALSYAMAQLDLDAFDEAALKKELSEPPYKDNAWATHVVAETMGRLKVQRAQYRAAIDALIKDEDWKTLLVDAPKAAITEWKARAATFKAELQRSREFEKKAFGPSRKAVKGCAATLRADFAKYLTTVKAKQPGEFTQAVISDSIGSLLMHRLIACDAADGLRSEAGLLAGTRALGADLRGPRLAALAAAISALGEVIKDRPKFPLSLSDARFGIPASNDLLDRFEDSYRVVGIPTWTPAADELRGSVVEKVKKEGDRTRVVFVTKKTQIPAHDCVDTNRIMSIGPDGTIRYYRSCTFGKRMVTYVQHLEDAVMPTAMATGIKPGAFVEVASTSDGEGLPLEVYSDSSKKKLVAWRGFPVP